MLFAGPRLSLAPRGRAELVLCVSVGSRLLMGATALILLTGMVLGSRGGLVDVLVPGNAVPLVLFCLSLLSALYTDRWVFNRDEGLCERQIGVAFLVKTKRISLSAIDRVEVSEYARASFAGSGTLDGGAGWTVGGARRRSFTVLTLVDADGGVLRLENASGSRTDSLVSLGRQLSDFCGVGFVNRTSRKNA